MPTCGSVQPFWFTQCADTQTAGKSIGAWNLTGEWMVGLFELLSEYSSLLHTECGTTKTPPTPQLPVFVPSSEIFEKLLHV